jgi:hypothetical protein
MLGLPSKIGASTNEGFDQAEISLVPIARTRYVMCVPLGRCSAYLV